MRYHVGTSGYSYKEWKGAFYPEKTPAKDFLSYYATQLGAVEINNTFYRLPKTSVVENWAAQVPADFRFSVKASRRITHMKRLKDCADETTYLMETIAVLGAKLGVVLFQLPPNFKQDLERLGGFLDLLKDHSVPIVFEFRHESWFTEQTNALLREHDTALVLSDTDDADEPELLPTASHGYLRLRRSSYTTDDLKAWAKRLQACAASWSNAFVFFKHEDEAAGPRRAREFVELVEQ